jgi:hypothetical protein
MILKGLRDAKYPDSLPPAEGTERFRSRDREQMEVSVMKALTSSSLGALPLAVLPLGVVE